VCAQQKVTNNMRKKGFAVFIITYSRKDMHIFINYVDNDLCSLKMALTYSTTLRDTERESKGQYVASRVHTLLTRVY
jgi:hypothetical protein